MFEQFTTAIPLAELFKKLVYDDNRRLGRRHILDRIADFESADWQPQALSEVWDSRFTFDGDTIDYEGENLFDDLVFLLTAYLKALGKETGGVSSKRVFSTKEAANYLGVSIRTMKYHIHTGKNLHGTLIGHSLIFTQEELDAFQRNRRDRGRPPKESKRQAAS